MEQVQNSALMELAGYAVRQTVETLSEPIVSPKSETSEFRKELEQQTQAAQNKDAPEQTEKPKAEPAGKPVEKEPEQEGGDAAAMLEHEQTLVQQMMAAGVVNMAPVTREPVPEESVAVMPAGDSTAVSAEAAAVDGTIRPAETQTILPQNGQVIQTQGEAIPVERPQSEAPAAQPTMQPEENRQAPETQTVQIRTVAETRPQTEAQVQTQSHTQAQPQAEARTDAPVQTAVQPQEQGRTGQEQGNTAAGQTAEQLSQQDGKAEVTEAAEGAEGAQPLFAGVDEVPVKVGEAEQPQQALQTANVEEQVTVKVTEALEQGESKVEIKLAPESLGTVTVELTRSSDGTLSVVISAESARTAELLDKNSAALQSMLAAGGQERVQVEVQNTQQSEQQAQEDLADGHRGGQQDGRQQENSRNSQRNSQDFLQQLRLGLIPMDEETV